MSLGGAKYYARAFVTKYYNQKFIAVTHILAAPIWAGIVPLQLHPGIRKNFRRSHRILGTLFFALSTSMMAGLAAMMKKKLQLQTFAPWAKGLEGRTLRSLPQLLANLPIVNDPFLVVSGCWFSYTLIRSWVAACKRRFGEHEEWALRHIASGQWVSLMRLIQATVMMPKLFPKYGDTQLVENATFGMSAFIAWIVCVIGAEIAVVRVKAHRPAAKKRNVAQKALQEKSN